MTVRGKRGIALLLAFLLVFQMASREEGSQASAVERGQNMESYHFLVTENQKKVSPDGGTVVKNAQVRILVSERINGSEYAGNSVSAADGSSILLKPGTEVGAGTTNGQGRADIQVPKGVPIAYCEYYVSCNGYRSLEKISMENVLPQDEIKAELDWIPVFCHTENTEIAWPQKDFVNVLVDSRGNAIPGAKYSIKRVVDNQFAEIAADEIGDYVSVDENTGKVTPANLEELSGTVQHLASLPLTVTIQGQIKDDSGQGMEPAEYVLRINKAEDDVEWENVFVENRLVFGTEGAVLRAVSSRNATVKYQVVQGMEFISIGEENGEITFVNMPDFESSGAEHIIVKAYTEESSLYVSTETTYEFDLVSLEVKAGDLTIQGYQNDDDAQLEPVNITYGEYSRSPKWFAGDSLVLVYEGCQFKDAKTENAQWEDKYDLTHAASEDGTIGAEFYVREKDSGKMSAKLKVEGILWDHLKPWNPRITYSVPLWKQEMENVFIHYYGKKEKCVEVTLSVNEDASGVAGFAWGYASREGKGNSSAYAIIRTTAENQGKNGVSSVTFTVDREDCMNLDFYAFDHAGNRSETYQDEQNAILLDCMEPEITIDYDNEVGKTYEGETYYDNARTATISIQEEHFTPKQELEAVNAKGWVHADLVADGNGEEVSVQIGNTSIPAGRVGEILQNSENWTREIREGKVYYIARITYRMDANYKFRIQSEDMAGNQSKQVTDAFWVDQTAPLQPELAYSQARNEEETDGVLRKYYNADTEITVTLQDNLSGITHLEWRENNDEDWKKVTEFEMQEGKATARLPLKGEGSRSIAVKAYDRAGNCTEYADDNTQVVIDSTNPNVTVVFAQAQAHNGRYFGEPRTARITIKENNFDASRIVVKARAANVMGETISGDTTVLVNNVPVTMQELPAELKKDGVWKYRNGAYQAEVVFDADADYQFDMQVQDLALLNSAEVKNSFCVDRKSPEQLAVTYSEPVLEKILNMVTFGYYKSHVNVKFSAADITSGVSSLHWSYAKESGTSAQNVKSQEGDVSEKDLIFSKDGEQAFYTLKLPANKDQQYRGNLAFTVTDKAGNKKAFQDKGNKVVVDNIAPTMKVSYTPINSIGKKAYFGGNAVLNFEVEEANFYKQDVEVTVNGEKAAIRNWKQEKGTDKWKGTLTFREDGDYKVKVSYQDRSGNEVKAETVGKKDGSRKTWVSPALVVDTRNPLIKVSYDNTTPVSFQNANGYYNRKRTATIQITDKNFRANEVEAAVTALRADGTSVEVSDYSAYLKQNGSWTKDGDTYTAKISYDKDANYTFDISYVDLAKNESRPYVQDKFTVDTAAPGNLQVQYSDSVLETVLENVSFGFYQAKATVTITAEDDVAGIERFIYSYRKAENVSDVNRESLEQRVEKAQISYRDGRKVATAQFTIPQSDLDANSQFNGIVEFTAVDSCNHQTTFTDAHRIVVDNIAPNAEVTYNAPTTSANGTDYYADAVEGQISVTEANFREEDIQVTAMKDGAPYILNVSWNDAGTDLHNGSFQIGEDGDYQISISYQDKSGNAMASYESGQITVDSTAPVISIAEVADKRAYNKDVIGFRIDVDDVNFDLSSFKPQLTGIVHEKNGRFAKKDFSELGRIETLESGKHYEYVIDNITEDAIYTLSCAVKDFSLNATSEMNVVENSNQAMEKVTFSVNRKGSTFMLDEPTRELVENYYVQEVKDAVVLQEVNCDPVTQHFVTVNGNELKENSQYLVRNDGGGDTWYQYDYVIDEGIFQEEGDYSVVVSTMDKAENMAYSDIKNVETSFVVDHTEPVVTVSGLARNGRYQVESQRANVIPTDDGGSLDSLEITISDRGENAKKTVVSLDRKQLAENIEKNDGIVNFEIPQGIGQKVSILCQDAAGNVCRQIYENVTVSTEWYIMILANRPLMFGITAVVAAMIAAGTVGVVFRRRKKRKI